MASKPNQQERTPESPRRRNPKAENEIAKRASACVRGCPLWLKCLIIPLYLLFFTACWSTSGGETVRITKWLGSSMVNIAVTAGITYQATTKLVPTNQQCESEITPPSTAQYSTNNQEPLPTPTYLISHKPTSLDKENKKSTATGTTHQREINSCDWINKDGKLAIWTACALSAAYIAYQTGKHQARKNYHLIPHPLSCITTQ